ncbi:FUSC family protein [Nocardia otitidiscaviarum]|uniref:Predicted membrane protein n=1 Tax=Nocardia otitidiscaviarum TaxID=1823 RepID=A0A378YCB3_9NOCA|nr:MULTISPECIES: FUSC family protein [Nocardia]MBF6138037.1 FUSC family protein [Nocardia otitidiscaviarum]MBF6183160.1 FUSC family protein [Nocardia otitidiscaviarum]MBF6241699.1 FUSC family protein [Nocardia otitidiscaviarum]MBF6489089.1 FUSC family protein [Nocardia otitidiscaviarum]MCP9622338.1 FUSC family protein [Nocardia otitidiscaviarum]
MSSALGGKLTTARESSATQLRNATKRVRSSWLPIVQCAVAAGLAWFISHNVIGHTQPFFAPMAAIISTGVSFGARMRRAVELMVGVAVGIGIGDLFISWVGTGVWQIALVVAVAMTAAVFLDSGSIITAQAASSAVLVATLLPPHTGGSSLRMIDALVGGLVGIVVVAAIPLHPVRRARQQAADILEVMHSSLMDCGAGLLEHDAAKVKEALQAVRGTQPQIDSLRDTLKGSEEVIRLSPLYWNAKPRLEQLRTAADPLDNAVRNTRVLLRRALSSVRDDEILDPRLVTEVEKLGEAVEVVRRMVLADPGEQPDPAEATRVLRTVAKGATKDLVADAGISAHVVFAQLRSIVVDLMEVCGMKRLSAIALLPPTVANPYVTPVD